MAALRAARAVGSCLFILSIAKTLMHSLAMAAQLLSLDLAAAAAQPAIRPHIVFILADDLGFNDVGFTEVLGAQPEAKTPFMDSLVQHEGRLLTHHYVYRLCAPTRAMLMVCWHATVSAHLVHPLTLFVRRLGGIQGMEFGNSCQGSQMSRVSI